MMLPSKLQNTEAQSNELDASENLWIKRHTKQTWFYMDGQDILVKRIALNTGLKTECCNVSTFFKVALRILQPMLNLLRCLSGKVL